MRFYPTRARAFARALVLSALLVAPARVLAQADGSPAAPIGQGRHHLFHLGCCSHARGPAIPRTYSYYYNTWFNQPCHFRVVGPDGKTYWRTTVRGLPLGTPWPSYGAPGLP
jgi:hypothetical protein